MLIQTFVQNKNKQLFEYCQIYSIKVIQYSRSKVTEFLIFLQKYYYWRYNTIDSICNSDVFSYF